MKLVPHGEPYAGKLHVRFDEGAGVPHGASRSTLHPYIPPSAAILPRERLYHAGDVNALALLLEKEYNNELPQCSIGEWTAKNAAKRLMEMV